MQECEVFRVEQAQMDLGANRVTYETMNQIREESSKDPVLAVLHKVVLSGWPSERKCPSKSEFIRIQETRSQCMVESFTRLIKLSYLHPCDLKCYGRYIKLSKAQIVIRAMKRNFARCGIPDKCITDNGHEYSRFGFTSTKSTPCHSQGNGNAESAVKIAKNILKKSRNEDPYLALLAYRNTPQQGYDCSPADRLMSQNEYVPGLCKKTLQKGETGQRCRTT